MHHLKTSKCIGFVLCARVKSYYLDTCNCMQYITLHARAFTKLDLSYFNIVKFHASNNLRICLKIVLKIAESSVFISSSDTPSSDTHREKMGVRRKALEECQRKSFEKMITLLQQFYKLFWRRILWKIQAAWKEDLFFETKYQSHVNTAVDVHFSLLLLEGGNSWFNIFHSLPQLFYNYKQKFGLAALV